MNNLKQRNYYKIHAGGNQTTSYDKLHLGFESNTYEVVFAKDKTTYFHIPYFSNEQPINLSTLIIDGAIPGPIPAMADRIYKKLGNYENNTSWGKNTLKTDGTWLCSWLYQAPGQPPQWVDRYYNPGRITYVEALEGGPQFLKYLVGDSLYYDETSQIIFEPGALYAYTHIGEQTIQHLVETFAGNKKNRIRLNIENWSATTTDNTLYNNIIDLKDSTNSWFQTVTDIGYSARNSLSFVNNEFIDAKVIYSDSYSLNDEFTLSFWFKHDNWLNATSTQLIGNRNNGGVEVHYNNLHYNPFFVIPENTYGHLFYFNQNNEVYTEKNIRPTFQTSTASPLVVNINSNSEVIAIDTNNRLVKYNHLGDIITTSKTQTGETVTFLGAVKLAILDQNNSTILYTTSATYIFDQDLIIQQQTAKAYNEGDQIAYNIAGILIKEPQCRDIKFDINNNKWVIKNNYKLYFNNIIFEPLQNYTCSVLGIDPDGFLWVVTTSREIFKVNVDTLSITSSFRVGINTLSLNEKNLSYIQVYNRTNNTFTWLAVLYSSLEQTLYQITLDGKILKTSYIPDGLNVLDPSTALQDKEILTFTGKGDFTGYEHRRIFNKIKYNNEPQVQFKLSMSYPYAYLPTSIYTLSTSAKNFTNGVWQLITVTYKNKQVNFYVNDILKDSLALPNNQTLKYVFKNDLLIGTPNGKTENLNYELNSKNIIWNGYIDTVRIYDYAIQKDFITILKNEKTIVTDIVWSLPTSNLQYIETIERFFKHKLPGFKSNYFNIKISGAQITDTKTRKLIENNIRSIIEQVKPAYTELFRIDWLD
jgi:hypothetical protein